MVNGMNRLDYDLCSMQEARILIENGRDAQRMLASFSQDRLDDIVAAMAEAVYPHAKELALLSAEETGFGRWEDKYIKDIFASRYVCRHMKGMKAVGIIAEDAEKKTLDIGIPVGVITALPPCTSPVSTTVYNALIAIKSGNAIIFSPHPRAQKVIGRTLDILIDAGIKAGMPECAVEYLRTVTLSGTKEMIYHKDTSLILITSVPRLLPLVHASGKPAIYGGPGNGPAFIEKTADVKKAVRDIVFSRTFDNGIISAAEQSIVAEECIAEDVRQELKHQGAYFLNEEETETIGKALFHHDGSINLQYVGRPAAEIASMNGIAVPAGTTVLISEQKYADLCNPYAREKLCPVLAFYVERDWRNACEKCIELLCNKGLGNMLVIHSQNEEVIREFALKKPVSRVLVNTPATVGGMGATTNLFPAFTLGLGAAGGTITSDNVSPMNLINIRKVGYGVRNLGELVQDITGTGQMQQRTNPARTMDRMRNEQEKAAVSGLIEEIVSELKKQGIYGGDR